MLARSQLASSTWHDYVELEMTVIPIPHQQKYPVFRWKRLQWTKLHVLYNHSPHDHNLARFYQLGGDGLAVICGRPSENLFVIDCDTPEALAQVKNQLAMRQIQAPCVLSGRGGHLYLRCREGAVKGISNGKIKDIEVKGDGELVVLPPTIHHSGKAYRWETGIPYRIPTISIEDIDFLIDVDGNTVQLKTSGNSERRLHDDTRRYLSHGSTYPEGTRNNALSKAAWDYVYVGKSKTAALVDLIRIAKASGLSDHEAAATIESAYKSPASTSKPSDTISGKLLAFMNNITWKGRTGITDKRLFAAMVKRHQQDAYNRQDGQFRASYRELMELAAIKGWKTIKRSIQRLKQMAYIQVCGNDDASKACIYRFTDMVLSVGSHFFVQKVDTNTSVAVRSTYCLTYAHPLSKSLGSTATDILNHLKESGQQTVKQIAHAISRHRSTVTRQLAKLLNHNLVCKNQNTYAAATITTVDEIDIIRETGTYAAEIQQAQRHDKERALFALNPIVAHLVRKNKKQGRNADGNKN